MSIINEALKKAGREKAVSAGYSLDLGVEDARRNLRVEEAKRKNPLNWGPFFIVLVLLLITGPIIAPVFTMPFKHAPYGSDSRPAALAPQQTQVALNDLGSGQTRQAQFGIEEQPLFNALPAAGSPVMPSRTGFDLSGVVFSPVTSYCILNDKVLKVGDSVAGATVRSIKKNQVILDYRGESVELNIS